MPIEPGWKYVSELLKKVYNGSDFDYSGVTLGDLEPEGVRRLEVRPKVHAEQACGLGYGKLPSGVWSSELRVWQSSLILAEYVAGMLADKAKDGHCYTHPKPCARGRDFHLALLRMYREDLTTLVDEIKTEEERIASMPTAGKYVVDLGK